jgi:hypothetical protein
MHVSRALTLTALGVLVLAGCSGPSDAVPASSASSTTPGSTPTPAPGVLNEHITDGLREDPATVVLPADAGAYFTEDDLRTFPTQAVETFMVVMETSKQTQRPESDGPLSLEYFQPVRDRLTDAAWDTLVAAFEAGDHPTVSGLVPSSALEGTSDDLPSSGVVEHVDTVEPYRPTDLPSVTVLEDEAGTPTLAVTFHYQRVFGASEGERVYDTDHTLYLVPIEGRWLVDGWQTRYPALSE